MPIVPPLCNAVFAAVLSNPAATAGVLAVWPELVARPTVTKLALSRPFDRGYVTVVAATAVTIRRMRWATVVICIRWTDFTHCLLYCSWSVKVKGGNEMKKKGGGCGRL